MPGGISLAEIVTEVNIVHSFLIVKESAQEIGLNLVLIKEDNVFSLSGQRGQQLCFSESLYKIKDFLDAYKQGYKDRSML